MRTPACIPPKWCDLDSPERYAAAPAHMLNEVSLDIDQQATLSERLVVVAFLALCS